MNIYKTQQNKTITNTFIQVSYIKTFDELTNIFNMNETLTNIANVDSFKEDLFNYEEQGNSRRSNSSINYGVKLTFMLDKGIVLEKSKLLQLINDLMNRFNNLPYYAYLEQRGNGRYLILYICERFYNEQGFKKEVFAKTNSYKSSVTGRLCNENDENAVLYHAIGDLISSKTEKFTSKDRQFHFSGAKEFTYFMTKLKIFFLDRCAFIFEIVKNKTITFRKYVYLYTKYKGVAKIYNNALEQMEQLYDDYLYIGEQLSDELNGQINKDVLQKMENLYREFSEKIANSENFNIDKIKIRFDLEHADRRTARATADSVVNLFRNKLIFIFAKAYN